jgi:hypothetical protein
MSFSENHTSFSKNHTSFSIKDMSFSEKDMSFFYFDAASPASGPRICPEDRGLSFVIGHFRRPKVTAAGDWRQWRA